MSKLDSSPDFDGIRDIFDSLTSTSGGSGSVAMNENDTRDRVTRKNDVGFAGLGSAPHYNTGTSTEARQAKDFKNTFRVTTGSPTPSWNVSATKSSQTNYWYGWGTVAGINVATLNQISLSRGSCWDGTTNHTTGVVPLGDYGCSGHSLLAVGKIESIGSASFVVCTNTDTGTDMNKFYTRSYYGGTPGGNEAIGSTGNVLNYQYTFGSNTAYRMQWGGGIYGNFATQGIPSSANSAFGFSFLPS